MDWALKHGQMVVYIKVVGLMVKLAVRESSSYLTVTFLMDNLTMTWPMAKVF
jgi:hypothetical protein